MSSLRSDLAEVREAQAGPGPDAQPCLCCMETLMAWANHLGYAEETMKKLVEDHPVEPAKTWTITGKGGITLRCISYVCERCGKTWKANRRA